MDGGDLPVVGQEGLGRLRVELWEARKIVLITEEQRAEWLGTHHSFKVSYRLCKLVILNDDLRGNKVGNEKQWGNRMKFLGYT